LVDYQSSSDEHSEAAAPPPPKKHKPTKARILIDLPPPISAHHEPQPTGTTPIIDKKAQKDTLLDKLKRKKPGSNPQPSSSGLASLLPPPKRTQPQPQPETSFSSSSLTLKPKAIAKIEHEPTPDSPSEPIPVASSSTAAPLDLFGLAPSSGTSKQPSKTSSMVEEVAAGCSVTVSSAPQVAEEVAPAPGLLDPYPGYWQRKDGSWVARDPEDPVWKAFYLQHYAHPSDNPSQNDHLLKDFFKDAPPQLAQFDAKLAAKTAWENKPKVIDPREEARQEQLATAKPAKHISSRARGRHQLTSLLTDAQANRAELEDRIARGKFNRKAGGAKYGF